MLEEKIYRLKNGQEMVLMDRLEFNGQRYLLLVDNENEDNVKIGYEKDNNLYYLDENEEIYEKLILEFSKKINID